MHIKLMIALIAIATTTAPISAQGCAGAVLTGTVRDTTFAMVAEAAVTLDDGAARSTDEHGSFSFNCVAPGPHSITVAAVSFAPAQMKVTVKGTSAAPLSITLRPETVDTAVDAVEDTGIAVDSQNAAGAKTLSKQDLNQLADDPDDFQRELQTLAAAAGGTPGQAIIAVDGFQNGSRMPPKSSIAFVRLNPDLFSAEYERPPYQGGRIEVYTKPGAGSLHGSVFFNTSDVFMNAKDPFATSRAAIGKQRFGFDLNGPLVKKRSDFNLNLERRNIDEFATVNAVTLDASGNQQTTIANVPTPQRLWIGSARVGWQINPKNLLTTSYTATVNGLDNLGAGGTSLRENGYNSTQAEHTLRATNVTTVSPRMVHEARASLSFRTRNDTPLSTSPQVQVAGAFTGGGAASQAMRTKETVVEVDDDVLYSRGKHMLKAGVQIMHLNEAQQLPQNFNGTYIFGGGTAPALDASGTAIAGTDIAINGLEQYRRAVLKLSGGTPTIYTITTGTPAVNFGLFRAALYVQDQWKVRPRIQISAGLRYALQTEPDSFVNFAPRVGISWSPDKKQTWVLRAHTGLFSSKTDSTVVSEAERLNGARQRSATIYNPVFGSPLTGSTPIQTLKSFAPSVSQVPSLQSHLGIEHELPRHWHAQGNLYLVHAWNNLRTRNINSPLNGLPNGPRPGVANTNLLQFQQSGQTGGNVMFFGLDQHSYRRFQIFVGYLRMDLRSNADTESTAPQSAFTDAGERARPSWQQTHRIFALGTLQLPRKMTLTGNLDSASGTPYNVLTGIDNNGDGNFNDRPGYATPDTPGAVQTQYGLLTTIGGGGVLQRNTATMPWTIHLDMNLSRTFTLNPHAAADHQQSLAVNLRSANVLNHTNVTSVGNALGSPLFGRAFAADASRRVELGLRYSF